jgi:hypothetical protein
MTACKYPATGFRSHARKAAQALSVVLGLTFLPAIASGTSETHVTATGAGANMTATFGDSCNTGGVSIDIYGQATTDSTATPPGSSFAYALVYVYSYNSCTMLSYFESGFVTVNFSSLNVKGTQLPQSMTVSAQNVPSFDGTETFTFNLVVNGVGPAYEDSVDEQQRYTGGPNMTIHDKRLGNQGNAGGTLTMSTQQLGVLPISGLTGLVFDSKSHTVIITHN